jgi:hypothetical protein
MLRHLTLLQTLETLRGTVHYSRGRHTLSISRPRHSDSIEAVVLAREMFLGDDEVGTYLAGLEQKSRHKDYEPKRDEYLFLSDHIDLDKNRDMKVAIHQGLNLRKASQNRKGLILYVLPVNGAYIRSLEKRMHSNIQEKLKNDIWDAYRKFAIRD